MLSLLKNKKFFFSLILCIFSAIMFFSTFSSIRFTSAEENTSQQLQTNQAFTVSMLNRSNKKENTNFTQATLAFGNCFIYKWSEIGSIKFNYNPEISIPPIKYQDPTKPETEYYDLSISIEYIQRYKDISVFYQPFSNGYKNIESAFSTTITGNQSYTKLKKLVNEFTFSVDEGKTGSVEGQTIRIKDWGIYRFKLLVNGKQTHSDFFFLEPTMSIEKSPTTTYHTTSSTTSLHNNYVFSIKNLDEYKYIDPAMLKWYVRGKSTDGVLYALTEQDLTHEQFVGNAFEPLYSNYAKESRSGLTFRFDDNGVSGSWEIWCEYKYYGSTEDTLSSKITVIDTETHMNYALFIGAIAGVFLFAIGVTILFASIRAKKDKVY